MLTTREELHHIVDALSDAELQAAAQALAELRNRHERQARLLRELAKANPAEERELAEERLAAEAPWPAW